MSPLRRQSTIFLQSRVAEELNSDPLWIDQTISSAFPEDTFRLFEGAATSIGVPPGPPVDHLLPLPDDDHLGPPSTSLGDAEHAGFVGFTTNAYNMPFGILPGDIFGHAYRSTYTDLFENDYGSCVPEQVMPTYQFPPAPCNESVTTITQTLSDTHLSPAPVDPSTMTAYAPCFGYGYDSSQVPSTPDNTSVASFPPTSPPCCDSSESDGEGDTDYVPPSEDEEYRPVQPAPPQKQKKRKAASKSKSHRRQNSSPARSTSSESERSVGSSRADRRSHPYNHYIPSRNFQRDDGAVLTDKESDYHCPVVGCEYIQRNERVPDLKRHVVTHDRWLEPGKWTCCGVTMDRAFLYDKGIEEGMTEDQQIMAGAYMYKGQLMIGGCMKTFARRDALKRHVDNPNISCVGHMDSYPY